MMNEIKRINITTALLDAERNRQPVTFYTYSRRMITRFTCVDTENPPLTLHRFTIHGGLIYYKRNAFEWANISLDDVTGIEIDGVQISADFSQ